MRRASTSSASSRTIPKSQFIPDAFLVLRRVLLRAEGARERAQVLRQGAAVSRIARLRLREVQRGLGLLQPRRLQAGARDLRQRHRADREARQGRQQGQKIALGKEAKKDSVRAYARIGTPGEGVAFFQRIGGDYATTMLEQLGELYNAQGQFHDSIKVYRKLMALEPELAQAVHLAERGHEEHAVDDRLARGARRRSRSCSASAAVYEKVKDDEGHQEGAARGVPRQHRATRCASSRPSGTRKRRRPTTTRPTRSRSTSTRST